MKTKITIIIAFLLITIKVSSQEEKQLANKDGVKITYQLLLTEEGKKKDNYILIVNAINESNVDLYYTVPLIKNNTGQWSLPYTPSEKGFTKINVRNSTGLFGDGQSLIGDQTNLFTTNNSLLFELKSGNIYSQETSFKVLKGQKPLITNTFSNTLKILSDFDLLISAEMLNGDYISSCGDIKININTQNSPEKGDYLLQTTNGNQFIWIRSSETSFVRENNPDYTLTFNKNDNSYTYSTSDGINCSWIKK